MSTNPSSTNSSIPSDELGVTGARDAVDLAIRRGVFTEDERVEALLHALEDPEGFVASVVERDRERRQFNANMDALAREGVSTNLQYQARRIWQAQLQEHFATRLAALSDDERHRVRSEQMKLQRVVGDPFGREVETWEVALSARYPNSPIHELIWPDAQEDVPGPPELIPSASREVRAESSGGASAAIAAQHAPDAPRRKQVATLLAEDLTVKQIAARLGITESTVYKHRERLAKKMGVEPAVVADRLRARGQHS